MKNEGLYRQTRKVPLNILVIAFTHGISIANRQLKYHEYADYWNRKLSERQKDYLISVGQHCGHPLTINRD